MVTKIVLSAVLSLSLAASANAAVWVAPITSGDTGLVRVAEGCGTTGWRGPGGACNYGPARGWRWQFGYPCPPRFHLQGDIHRCIPN